MAMKFFRKLTAIAATAAVIAVCWNPLYTAARAEEPEPGIRMNTIFSDHMVLQRDKKVEIYGEAAAGASVKVTFKGQEKTCTAEADGNFSVYLDEMEADAQGAVLTVTSGSSRLDFSDVLVGEVYYGSGQSNMAYPFEEHTYAESVIKNDPSYGERCQPQ